MCTENNGLVKLYKIRSLKLTIFMFSKDVKRNRKVLWLIAKLITDFSRIIETQVLIAFASMNP